MERGMGASFFLPRQGYSFFGKNSSQDIRRPQAVRILPRRQPAGAIHVGNHEFSLPDAGYAYVCSVQSGATGGDMGVNERGVAIAMETPFSKFNAAALGPRGADYLQAALMASSGAEEARDTIIALTERHGQAGSARGPGGRLASASYIISGFDGAYIVETAAERWAWKALDEKRGLLRFLYHGHRLQARRRGYA
jgi:dipeptidase